MSSSELYTKNTFPKFQWTVETCPHYENEDYVFLMPLEKVLLYASVSSTVTWGDTSLVGLLRGKTKLIYRTVHTECH